MKQQKKTYGVIGMMEYQAVIKVGRNNMKVLFTDGSLSAMGNNPAKFVTDNFMVQHAIENSAEFKSGRIRLLNTVEMLGEVKVIRNPISKEPTNKLAEASEVEDIKDDEPIEPTPANGNSETTAEEVEEEVSSEVANETASELKQVEVTCNDDAKDYLEINFGVKRSKLRLRSDIIAAGEANGIEFVFAK